MNVKVYLDTRSVKKDGRCPLKYVICHRGKSALLSSGIDIDPKRWDTARLVVKSGEDKLRLNESIARRLAMVQAVVGKIVGASKLELSANDLKKKVVCILGQGIEMEDRYLTLIQIPTAVGEDQNNFIDYYTQVMNMKTPSTAETYLRVLRRMEKYDARITTYTFEDITPTWIEGYLQFVAKTAPAQNSRNFHVRCIRAVWNRAIREGLTRNYPLNDIKYKRVDTEHRNLSVDDLRYIFEWTDGVWSRRIADYFKLMFFLIGINAVDLFDLKKADVYDGRLHYVRHKTGRHYSIKLEPEALEIINRHKGRGEWLLDCRNKSNNYRNWWEYFNKGLKRIGREGKRGSHGPGKYPFLSTYYTRHSWATIAHNDCNIQMDDIRLALGHGRSTITDVYIKPDLARIDNANRKVLDYVLYNKV